MQNSEWRMEVPGTCLKQMQQLGLPSAVAQSVTAIFVSDITAPFYSGGVYIVIAFLRMTRLGAIACAQRGRIRNEQAAENREL